MIARETRAPLGARRLGGGSIAILLATGAAVWLLTRLGLPLVSTRNNPTIRLPVTQDWGLVAVGVAAAYFAPRLLDDRVFDLTYRLRRKTPVPALWRQLIGLLVFCLGVSALPLAECIARFFGLD